MKSLQKAFDVLEYVILQNGNKVTPTEGAAALGLNTATVTRILQDLTGRGYLVRVSRNEGYAPGPMVTSISTRMNVFTRLSAAAEEPLKELSETLHRQVNIAVLNGGRRIMLRFHAPDSGFTPWDHFFFKDHWLTATGRLLTAMLDDAAARKVCADCGITPFPAAEIAKIRKEGAVRFRQDELTIIGHSIRVPGFPNAAFGFGVSDSKAEEAFCLSSRTAEIISGKLTKKVQAY